ncbi:type II toxin-antitoxin system RelE/ParE family toxin [Aliarcobacter butzleri]|uniref:type II toxin-antitoxin system RelE/ParE family toxin n=1 Tax=Aliarcobacter butzleri TaxID=28197 RepID=UPI00263F5314|nr:type II toxin-antitoxin system RelE/ParE family toxin [Aliarcobacter butzleri]MDN5092130.1 type II toxin-antitoxin system RelE/ParE family toxin [Aliarcobacter butzleri]
MKKITSLFYETSSGNKPVREWLLSLDKEDKKTIGNDIKTVEYGFPIGMPVCRKLVGTKLYEVRSNISNQRIARVIFVIIDEYMILLNGFIKKEQKTPKNEIDIALQRMKDIKWT